MSNITPIKPAENASAIKVLEVALEKAKQGEIRAVAIAYYGKEDNIEGDWSAGPKRILLWASIEHVAKSFYNQVVCE